MINVKDKQWKDGMKDEPVVKEENANDEIVRTWYVIGA